MNVNEWFANGPSEVVDQIIDMLSEDIEIFNLEFECKMNVLKHKLSTALCLMYTLHLQNKPIIISFPKLHNYPIDWDSDTEREWLDFIESTYFDYTYWERFWDSIPYSHWENDIHNWRVQLQCLIPLYVKRDIHKLHANDYETSESDEGGVSEQEIDYPNK